MAGNSAGKSGAGSAQIAGKNGINSLGEVNRPNRKPMPPNNDFPRRNVRWYQVTSGELRNVGVFQAASALLAAVGTFALQTHLDLQKDEAVMLISSQPVPDYLKTVSTFSYNAWLITWALAFAAFAYQLFEIHRIKIEHGEMPIRSRIANSVRKMVKAK